METVGPPVPYPGAKRALDRLVAGLLLALAAPALALVLAAMAVEMVVSPAARGPFLYRERRISRGREFDLLKLRTLRADVVAGLGPAGEWARLREADEGNLTWAGRRLLKPWYLDELPQLVNVLRGEMSLVGPRAWPVPMVADQVAEGLDYRLRVVAGLTGPAQLEKGNPTPVSSAQLDLAYVAACERRPGWRIALGDVRILGETLRVIARGEGLKY